MKRKKPAPLTTAVKEIQTLADISADERNANRGTVRGMAQLEHSMQMLGAGRSIVVDRHGQTIAGNRTAETWGGIGNDDRIVVVKTDGSQLVVVQRTDLDLNSSDDTRARALALADNRIQETNLNFDPSVILALEAEGVEVGDFWLPDELTAIRKQLDEEAASEARTLEIPLDLSNIYAGARRDPATSAASDSSAAAAPAPVAPEQFRSLDPDAMETRHVCPRCQFEF